MPFFLRRRQEQQPKQETSSERLQRFIEFAASELRQEGIAVDQNCRIDMEAFAGVYSARVIAEDKQEIERMKEKWQKNIAGEIKDSEEFEKLKTAIFYKNLRNHFVVARASRYDDIKNGVDNVIIDKESGAVVCAFDEVGQTSGSDYEEKNRRIHEKNVHERGAKLKYGIIFETGGNRPTPKLERLDHIPIFYLALPPAHISEGLRKFDPALEQQSDYEQNLFTFFIASLEQQIQNLELKSRQLAEPLRTRLSKFSGALKKLKK